MWDVHLHGETLFQSNLDELETRVSQHMSSMQLSEQRAILLGLLHSRVKTLSVGAIQRTVTGRSSLSSPIPKSLPMPKSSDIAAFVKEQIRGKELSSDSYDRLLNDRDVNTALDHIGKEAQHYKKLGEGKPEGHEYNILARGLARLYHYKKLISDELYSM